MSYQFEIHFWNSESSWNYFSLCSYYWFLTCIHIRTDHVIDVFKIWNTIFRNICDFLHFQMIISSALLGKLQYSITAEFLCLCIYFYVFWVFMFIFYFLWKHVCSPLPDACSANHFNSFALSNWIKQHFVFYNSMWLSGSYIRCMIWFGLHCQSNSQQKAVCIDNPV